VTVPPLSKLAPFVVGALILLGVRALIPDGTATAGAPQPPAGFVLPSDEPFPGATATTLRNAEEGVSFQVLRPSDPLASDDSITGVWMNTQNQQVAIDYAPGVRLYLTVVDPPKDPGGDAKELAAEMGGAVENVQGVPALALPAKNPGNGCEGSIRVPAQNNPAALAFYLGNLNVELVSLDMSDDALVRIAQTIG